jgi:predicted nucleic acid-binding protein
VIVIDASVAVKWYFREVGSDAAQRLLEQKVGLLIGPDLLLIEVCAAFVRGANVDKSRREDAQTFIADFRSKLDDGTIRTERLTSGGLATAASLAIDLGHPLKDCLYLALAMELDCDLVTCDARFAEKAKGVWARVRVLGE